MGFRVEGAYFRGGGGFEGISKGLRVCFFIL